MKVFITGITGTLGTALAEEHHQRGDTVIGCARSESKIVEWIKERPKVATVLMGDVTIGNFRSLDILRVLGTVDRVYHCAALKHVDICESQPMEAAQQNIIGTVNITSCCRAGGISCVVISTDKACMPNGVYGATKLICERVAISEGASVVRLGNLIGSSGSVFQTWRDAARNGEPIKITAPSMSRFFIPTEEAARFIIDSSRGITAPLMKAVTMSLVANHITFNTRSRLETIGLRPGETLHQYIAAPGEMVSVLPDRYVIGTGYASTGISSHEAEQWDVDELLGIAAAVK